MSRALLVTRPQHDITTYYLCKWSAEVVKKAKEKHISVIDLPGKKSTRKRVIGALEKRNPRLVFLNGHGNKDVICGHNNEVILKADDKKAVAGKIICARSCRSAKILGPKAIAHGGVAYLGYKEDFWFAYSLDKISHPLEDKTAALCLAPSNYLVVYLLKGYSTGETNRRSKALFRKNIEKLLVEEPEDYYAIRYLYWDMIHQVCIGDQEAVF